MKHVFMGSTNIGAIFVEFAWEDPFLKVKTVHWSAMLCIIWINQNYTITELTTRKEVYIDMALTSCSWVSASAV